MGKTGQHLSFAAFVSQDTNEGRVKSGPADPSDFNLPTAAFWPWGADIIIQGLGQVMNGLCARVHAHVFFAHTLLTKRMTEAMKRSWAGQTVEEHTLTLHTLHFVLGRFYDSETRPWFIFKTIFQFIRLFCVYILGLMLRKYHEHELFSQIGVVLRSKRLTHVKVVKNIFKRVDVMAVFENTQHNIHIYFLQLRTLQVKCIRHQLVKYNKM